MSSEFVADGPCIEGILSLLLRNDRFRIIDGGRVVSINFSDVAGSSNIRILLTRILLQLAKLTHLQELNISGGKELDSCLPPQIGNLCHLEILSLSGFDELRSLPKEIGDLRCLKQLHLVECKNLSFLPAEVGKLTALEKLCLSNCGSLTCISAEIGTLPNLKCLHHVRNQELKTLSTERGNLEALETLRLHDCYSLTSLPAEIGSFSNLKVLDVSYCPNLKSLPAEIGNLTALEDLNLFCCRSLTCLPAEIGGLSTNLRALDISCCSEPLLDSLSEWIGNLSSLESISLEGYDRGLETKIWNILSRLPESVVRISLRDFSIEDCKSLYSMRLPRRLRYFDLAHTPLMKRIYKGSDDGQQRTHEGSDDGQESTDEGSDDGQESTYEGSDDGQESTYEGSDEGQESTYVGSDDGQEKKIDILKLLNEYIELGTVCCELDYWQFEESRLFSPEAEHLLDINECGRVLLTEASFALSVWPIVLDRANTRLQEYPSRNANVLYSLLHGPVCASRVPESFVEDRK
jgi:Leucine-rich repeat (LRR) protein